MKRENKTLITFWLFTNILQRRIYIYIYIYIISDIYHIYNIYILYIQIKEKQGKTTNLR